MALSKDQNELKRQSFDERFGDDLCEEILQYLPLNDKLGLECVSKQFQRTVFVRTYNLDESDIYHKGEDFLKAFETIVKKCPNMKSLEIPNHFNALDYNRVIQLIIKYCHHLSHTNLSFRKMSEQIRKEFIEKFCTKLQSLKQISYAFNSVINSIKLFPNIEELELIYASNSSQTVIELKKLKKLKINCNFQELEELEELEALQELNGLTALLNNNSIEVLHIDIRNIYDMYLKPIFDQILKLQNLIEFKFDTIIGLNDKRLKRYVKQIAVNCPKLKSIGTTVTLISDDLKKPIEYLNPLKRFKQLKRLELSFDHLEDNFFSYKGFKGFENITHLRLGFCQKSIPDEVLEIVDINLPKLQYLDICRPMYATESTPFIPSRLTELHSIKLKLQNNEMKEFIETKLKESLKKLKYCYIKVCSSNVDPMILDEPESEDSDDEDYD